MLTLNRASFSVLALFALLAALVYLPAAPPLHPIPDRDGGVFLYIADQMLHGAVPYRDVWDHKPPGAYLLPLLGLAMSPESLWGPWVLACLLLSAAAYSGYTILRRYIATPLSLSITCIWLLELISFVRRDPFLTETTAVPFQIGSFGLAVWLAQHPPWNRARWGWLALGGSIAACILLKPPLAGLPLLATILALWRHRRSERLAGVLLWIASGLLAPLGAVLLYIAANNAVGPFADQVLFYNASYSNVSWHARLMVIWGALQDNGVIAVSAFIAWIGLGRALRHSDVPVNQRPFLLLIWMGWPLDLALSSFSGRLYIHYFIGSFWLEMVLIGWFLGALGNYVSRERVVWGYRTLFLGILFLSSLLSWHQTLKMVTLGEAERQAAVSYLNANLPGDLPVFFWGAETSLYLVTHRTAATRIIYQYPLYTIGYHTAAVSRELRDDIEAQTPRIIIDTSATDLLIPPLDPDGRARWRSPVDTYGLTPGSDVVSDYVWEHYVQIDLIGGIWPVYERK